MATGTVVVASVVLGIGSVVVGTLSTYVADVGAGSVTTGGEATSGFLGI